jgi:hypothetical protein
VNDFDYLVSRVDPWISKYHRFGADVLTPLETVGVGVWMLEAEVNNGGFGQYYCNAGGDLALTTVSALKSIGAARAAGVLEAANAEFPDASPPNERSKRQEMLDRCGFKVHDRRFQDYRDDLLSLLANYLRQHQPL